jgi:hypothetical protein
MHLTTRTVKSSMANPITITKSQAFNWPAMLDADQVLFHRDLGLLSPAGAKHASLMSTSTVRSTPLTLIVVAIATSRLFVWIGHTNDSDHGCSARGLKKALDPDRQIAQALAGGVTDSIGDSCREADDGDFAQALVAGAAGGAIPAPVIWALAVCYSLSRVMVGSLLKELFVAHIRFNRMRYDRWTSVKVKLLDDGIVDTLASVGAASAFTLPFPSTPRTAREPPRALPPGWPTLRRLASSREAAALFATRWFKQVLDPDRQIVQALAGGVTDSIGDSCREADYGDFAQDAYYARKVEIRSRTKSLARAMVACSTVDEFASALAEP